MKFGHLVRLTRSCLLTVDYHVHRVFRAHFSHFSFITEMDSSLVFISPFIFLCFRAFYDFDVTSKFYCRRKSFEYLNSPEFQFLKSKKLSCFVPKFT